MRWHGFELSYHPLHLTFGFIFYILCAITNPIDLALERSKNYVRKLEYGGTFSIKDTLPEPRLDDGTIMDSIGEKNKIYLMYLSQ